ncbi:MAG: glycosyltransferase family 87 protein [Candidatus Binataceae bacterium]
MSEPAASQYSTAASAPRARRSLLSRLFVFVLLPLLWASVVFQVVAMSVTIRKRADRKDFAIYYLSGMQLNRGLPLYQTEFAPLATKLGMDTGGIDHATDPPSFIALFAPLSRLPLKTSVMVWTAINFACLVLSLILLIGPGSGLSPWAAWTFAALVFWYPPVVDHFYYGQNKIILLAMLVLMMHWMRRRRDAWAGLMLALACLTRLFPLLMAGYLILERRWRVLAYTVIGIIAGGLLTVAVCGIPSTLAFSRGVSLLTGFSTPRVQDIAMAGFISRLFWRVCGAQPGAALDLLRHAAIAAADIAVVLLVIRASLTTTAGADRDWRIFSLWAAAAIVLSPVAWPHYMVIFIIPFAQMAVAASDGRASRRAIVMALTSCALITLWMLYGTQFARPKEPWFGWALSECGFFAMFTGFVAAYWFAMDAPDALPAVPLRAMPRQVLSRVLRAAPVH